MYSLRGEYFVIFIIYLSLLRSNNRNAIYEEQFSHTHVQPRRCVIQHCHRHLENLNIDLHVNHEQMEKAKKLLIHVLKLSPIELKSSPLVYFEATTRRESAA
jgi:hypothetical protein